MKEIKELMINVLDIRNCKNCRYLNKCDGGTISKIMSCSWSVKCKEHEWEWNIIKLFKRYYG